MDSGNDEADLQSMILLALPEDVLRLIAAQLDFISFLRLRVVAPNIFPFPASSLSSGIITEAVLMRYDPP